MSSDQPVGPALAETIRALREGQRLTYVALAERLTEVGRPIPIIGLRRIERGERRVDVEDLLALALALRVTPVDLLHLDLAAVPGVQDDNGRLVPVQMRSTISIGSRETLARLLWAEIASSGQRQCDVADTVGISEKHLSQTINGHTGMQLDVVDQVLAACGRRLVLATEPITEGAIDR